MIDERIEELAALHAVHLIDEDGRRELLEAARRDPAVQDIIRAYADTAAKLAFGPEPITPPPGLKQAIMDRLPSPARGSRIIPFPTWIPYAAAAGLAILAVAQAVHLAQLELTAAQLRQGLADEQSEMADLRQSTAVNNLKLAVLELTAKGKTDLGPARIAVAWNSTQHQGFVSLQNLPAAPTGHDYQLWVLDPSSTTPLSAGVVTDSRAFQVGTVGNSAPGFAISLEPKGGSPAPTGPILFASSSGA